MKIHKYADILTFILLNRNRWWFLVMFAMNRSVGVIVVKRLVPERTHIYGKSNILTKKNL